jgi:glycosyltransferase involved in cell wall biosynthesis
VSGDRPGVQPRASVIVPVRNAATFILCQLEALRVQAARNTLEVVVVDDASTDSTPEVIAEWISNEDAGRFRLIQRAVRGGPNAARNVGIAAARSEFLLFCDGDDIVGDSWSDAFLAARDDGVILCGALKSLSADSSPLEWALPPAASGRQYAYGGNMAVARSIVERLGGFDENILAGGTELDFAIRARHDVGATVTAVPAALVRYRLPTTSWGRLTWQFQKERGRNYLRRKHGGVVLREGFRSSAAAWATLLVLTSRGVLDRSVRRSAADLAGRLIGRIFWPLIPRALLVSSARRRWLNSPTVGPAIRNR